MKNKNLLKKAKNSFFVSYTFMFAVVAFCVFFTFITFNCSFIWKPDGTSQHFVSLVYLGKYLREVIKNIFSGNIVIPQYDLSVGFGEDIFTVFQYYVIGDPLDLLSALFPSKYTVYLYNFLIVLRFYLAGLSFGLLAKYKKLPNLNSIAGALVYAFGAYGLFLGLRHPFFLNPMIYYPLIILGIEKIFDKKRPYLFIFMIFLSAISNFYFFYILTFFTILYIFVRLFFVYKENIVKNFFVSLLKFGGCYLLGVLLASFIFVPVVTTFLSSNRGGVEYGLNLFYDLSYYENFLTSFASQVDMGKLTYLGFTAMGIVGIIFLFFGKKKNTFLKTSLIILTVLLMFPIFGKAINGFAYVTNRWVWVYGLLVAYVLAVTIDDIKNVTFKQSLILCGASAFYGLYSILIYKVREEANFVASILFIIFAVITLIYTAYPYVVKSFNKEKFKKIYSYSILLFVILGIACNGLYSFGRNETSYVSEFMTIESAKRFANGNGFKKIQNIQDTKNAVERYNVDGIDMGDYNNAAINETHGTTEYFSMSNHYFNDLRLELGEIHSNFSFVDGNYGDPFLNIIQNVKYQAVKDPKHLPYGYNNEILETIRSNADDEEYGDKLGVYSNKNYVPFGYTYSNVISQEEYDSLNTIDKRVALSQAVLINDSDEFVNEKVSNLEFNSTSAPLALQNTSDILVEKGKVFVDDTKSRMEVKVSTLPKSQVYCVFKGLKFTPYDEEDAIKKVKPDSYKRKSTKELQTIRYRDRKRSPVTRADIKIKYDYLGNTENYRMQQIDITTPHNDYYSGLTDFTVNLGYFENPQEEITLYFSHIGEYDFDSIELISVPMEGYEEKTKNLSEDTLQNLVIGNDTITGTIDLDKEKWLYLSLPYSKNWTATVDGEKVETYRANTAFTAIKVGEGNHEIKFSYSNKLFKFGVLMNVPGIVIVAGVIIVWEINNKKKKKIEDK